MLWDCKFLFFLEKIWNWGLFLLMLLCGIGIIARLLVRSPGSPLHEGDNS